MVEHQPAKPVSRFRPWLATLAGIVFFVLYIGIVIRVPDLTGRMAWPIEALYWLVAGIAWAFPIWWLMLWSVGKR